MAFINCCLTRTDSLVDLQLSINQLETQSAQVNENTIEENQAQNQLDNNENVGDDDLLFMDNFPLSNQSLNRIVSLRRRHPNTPSMSPEPPPLPPHPFPIGIPPGFPNVPISLLSSPSNVAAASMDDTYQPTTGASHIYEPYPIPPFMDGSMQLFSMPSNSSTTRSTPTFHTQIDYINRLVPDLLAITNCSFYWGKMDRYEAERLLDGKPEGTFLLRDSAQEDHLFSVSFRRFERSLHARIEHQKHRFSFDSHDPGVFSSPTVTGLIEHYKDPSNCMFFEPILTKPLNRTFTFSLQHLARVTICDHVSYDSINRLPLPTMLKSYLKEYHYRIKVRTRHFDESFYRWMGHYQIHFHN